MKPSLFLLLLLLLCSACGGDQREVSSVMEARYRERIEALTGNLRKLCEAEVLEVARARADSLLIDRAKRQRRIAGRPPRPPRPGEPPVRELSAPLPLRPLFPFEIRFDTLLRDSLYQDSIFRDSIRLLELSEPI